jgi:UDP-N-acetylglucosamine acyltransferase
VIHPTAIVDPAAVVAEDVHIGPYSIVGADVEIGPCCEIGPHVTLKGPTRLGAGNRIFQYASVGEDPQDKKFAGERTWLHIGNGNTIREFVTIHRGTAQDEGRTVIGDGNWIMAYVHIAHDSRIGSGTVFANGASLAGHVQVDDCAILGGFTLVHQFCRIGAHSFSSMGSCVKQDVPPYVTVAGNPAAPHGINAEGLRRRGFDEAGLRAIRNAYRLIYKRGLRLEQAIAELDAERSTWPQLDALVGFLQVPGRGIVR